MRVSIMSPEYFENNVCFSWVSYVNHPYKNVRSRSVPQHCYSDSLSNFSKTLVGDGTESVFVNVPDARVKISLYRLR